MKSFTRLNFKYAATITAIATLNSANAGQFFAGSSLNIENNSYDFSLTAEQKTINSKVKVVNKITDLEEQKKDLTAQKTELNKSVQALESKYNEAKKEFLGMGTNGTDGVKEGGLQETLNNAINKTSLTDDQKTEAKGAIFTKLESPTFITEKGEFLIEVQNGAKITTTDDLKTVNDAISSVLKSPEKITKHGAFKTSFNALQSSQNKVKEIEKTLIILNEKDTKNTTYTGSIAEAQAKAKEILGLKTSESDAKLTEEIKNIQDKGVFAEEGKKSKVSPGLSLMAGYRVDVDNFGFITEVGTDISFSSKIGKKSDGEIEMKKGLSFFLAQKVGYSFVQNNLTYLNLGVAFTKYDVSHSQIKDASKTLVQPLVGAGHEFKMDENLSLFAEFNILFSGKFDVKDKTNTTKVGEIKASSQQFKIGARYYF